MQALPYRKVARALTRLGFKPIRQKGSHVRFLHPDGRRTTVPNHPSRDIRVGLLREICRQIDITPEEFAELV